MRLFASADRRVERFFGQVVATLWGRAEQQLGQGFESCEQVVWISAGSIVAQQVLKQAIKRNQVLARAWGSGSVEKALRLTRLFTLALVSRYYSLLDADDVSRSEEQKRELRRTAAIAVSVLCGEDEAYTADDFVKVDVEYRHRRDDTNGTSRVPSLYELGLICDLALQMCGLETGLDLRSPQFPLSSYLAVIGPERRVGAMPEDCLMLAAILPVGVTVMENLITQLRSRG